MRHVDNQKSPHGIGNLTKFRKVPLPRISAAARDDHFRLVLIGEFRHMIEIDALIFPPHLIADDAIGLAGKVQLVAMRQMTAVRQIEAHDRIAWLDECRVGSLIRLRSGMRLYVNVLGVKELFRTVARQRLYFVSELAPA